MEKNTPAQITGNRGHRRDVAVDYFKMLATLLVMNSHAEVLYPKYKFLASGGAVGDGLFMFCSGFTLFMGTMGHFDNYYKRRLTRIIPSIVAVSIILEIFNIVAGHHGITGTNIGIIITPRNYLYWILLFYIPLFYVRKYLSDKMMWVFVGLTLMVGLAYFYFPYKNEVGGKGMWGSQYHNYKWFWYFVIMFWGAYIGSIREKIHSNITIDSIMSILCFVGFYAFPSFAMHYHKVAPYQVLMIPILMGFLFFLYRLLSSRLFVGLYEHKFVKWLILMIGGLCLESYLVHAHLFTSAINNLFPLNLVIIYFTVLIVAYIVRCLARTILQTFESENYRWREVIKLI